MKVIPLPEDGAARQKRAQSLKSLTKAYNVCLLAFALGAVAFLVGVLVVVIMLELGDPTPEQQTLYYILTGAFAGGAVLFAAGSLLLGKLSVNAADTHQDFVERCCGEQCFTVGEDTIAEFTDDGLAIRSRSGARKERILVPYQQMRVFSVCTRQRPQERGTWSVILDVPSKLVMKKGKDPRALIETKGKERLYRTLEERGIELQGEQPPRGEKRDNVRFKARTKFLLPDQKRRRRSLVTVGVSAAVVVAGVLVAVLLQDFLLVGAILAVFGVVLAVRSLIGFARAKGMIAFYEEGVYWRESGRPESDKFFLKWSELVAVRQEKVEGRYYLAAVTPYGSYHIPEVEGAYSYLKEVRPALCED